VQNAEPHPLIILQGRLERLGQVLGILCLTWVGGVGLPLLAELTPDDMAHHRAPTIRERVHQCEGPFAERYDCAEAILLNGERVGTGAVLLRLAIAGGLPAIAWITWTIILRRSRELTRMARVTPATRR
jgi:hypothetical protein